MSFIVYGPQGCGKTRNAEALRKFFKANSVYDDAGDIYAEAESDPEWKGKNILYLTNIAPPDHLREIASRRIIDFDSAMSAINPHGDR